MGIVAPREGAWIEMDVLVVNIFVVASLMVCANCYTL